MAAWGLVLFPTSLAAQTLTLSASTVSISMPTTTVAGAGSQPSPSSSTAAGTYTVSTGTGGDRKMYAQLVTALPVGMTIAVTAASATPALTGSAVAGGTATFTSADATTTTKALTGVFANLTNYNAANLSYVVTTTAAIRAANPFYITGTTQPQITFSLAP